MLLVVGGAYAGKRAYVRQRSEGCAGRSNHAGKPCAAGEDAAPLSWISAYHGDDHRIEWWKSAWPEGSQLVLEGWEEWVAAALRDGSSERELEQCLLAELDELHEEELRRGGIQAKPAQHGVVLIMLEMGRGIVPASAEERSMRDTMGRLLQGASALCSEVVYVWHGLPRRLKG